MSRKAKKASRHHHTVPKFHLRGFADEDRMLRQIDLETGRQTTLCITDATVRRDFYTLHLPDGSRSDMWERRLAAVENEVAPMLRAATRAESWEAKGQQRAALSLWMGLQLLRGQGQRSQLSQIQALMMRMTVGMGGLAYLQHAMSEGLGRPVPLEEAEVVWEDVHKPGGPAVQASSADHLSTLRSALRQTVQNIHGRSWHRVRFVDQSLAINDSPVALIPDEGHPGLLGVGLKTAGSVTVALDRRTLLWLAGPELPDTDAFPPSDELAHAHNRSVVFGAHRFVYTHPDDADPTGDLLLPRPPRTIRETGGLTDFANRDRPLDDVLAQIVQHERDSDPDSLIANYTWPYPGYVAPVVDDA